MAICSCPNTSLTVPRAAFPSQILQNIKMAFLSCICTSPFVPGAPLTARPLQNFKGPVFHCRLACFFVPRAARSSGPFQNLKMASICCGSARVFVPRAPHTACPLQNFKVASSSCPLACRGVPGARGVLATKPLQYREMAAACRARRGVSVPLQGRVEASSPLEELQMSVAGCRLDDRGAVGVHHLVVLHPLKDAQVPFLTRRPEQPNLLGRREVLRKPFRRA